MGGTIDAGEIVRELLPRLRLNGDFRSVENEEHVAVCLTALDRGGQFVVDNSWTLRLIFPRLGDRMVIRAGAS